MGWFSNLFGRGRPAPPAARHECGWCGKAGTVSRKYKDLDLVFPMCSDTRCHDELDRFLSNSACLDLVAGWMSKFSVADSMGIPPTMKRPDFAHRIERLRKYVRMQRP